MEVNRTWKEFIEYQKCPWIRIIEKYVNLKTQLKRKSPLSWFGLEWITFLKASNVTILKEIVCVIIKYRHEDLFSKQGDPLIYAEVVAKLLCKENSDQPEDEFGRTPLHFAAMYGHLELCQLIHVYFGVVNPKD